jgi:phosphohistidine phosphatase SixA
MNAVLQRLAGAAALCLFSLLAHAEAGIPDPEHALEGKALVSALQKGGLVIYFRHTDTGPPYAEQQVDLRRCETQRNLNDNGREEAQAIGAAFKRLAIPVGAVYSSEYCRCKDTAQLAFGHFEVDPKLTGVSRAPEAAGRRDEAARALRQMLGRAPKPGTSTILVSHGYNLWDAEGFHLGTQGEAAIYRPDGAGAYALVARVLPRQWQDLDAR